MTGRLRSRLRRRGERGAATAFIVGMAVTLLACAGLVVDGGSALNARMKLADDAEQAARAGAQELDQGALRDSGVVRVDVTAAQQRAVAFMTARGYTVERVLVQGDSVTVAASDVVDAQLLTIIGIRTFSIEATATADAVTQ